MPELQVIELPYVIRDDLVAECMVKGPFFEDARKTFLETSQAMSIWLASAIPAAFRNFFTAKNLVKTAAGSRGCQNAGDQLAIAC